MMRVDMFKSGTRATQVALVLFLIIIFSSCSTRTRQIFFDVQPPTAEELAEKNRQDQARREATLAALDNQQTDTKAWIPGTFDDNLPRPEIESITDWEQVLEMLPKDYKGKADWSAAIEQGLVRPRTGADPKTQYAVAFKYDFVIQAEKTKNDAYFPHSAHTEWLGCKNCHMTIYPNKRNPATMKEMRKGASCGSCHGKVAFSLKQCKRCHLNK